MIDARARFKPEFYSETRFSITAEMVRQFALLTGDRSALHVSDAFARRSVYRQPVVHGMLPVAFLSVAEGLRVEGWVGKPIAIIGQFVAPAYIGDELALILKLSNEQDSDTAISFDYQIKKLPAQATVTEGKVSILYEEMSSETFRGRAYDAEVTALLLDQPQPTNRRLGEISKGDSDGFRFVVTEKGVEAFLAIVAGVRGNEGPRQVGLSGGFYCPNLLGVLLFSTLVGMRLPGTSATFLEFSAKVDEEVRIGKTYRLAGRVSHISRGTSILKTSVDIQGEERGDTIAIAGKVASLVNRPLCAMPTTKELKMSAMDFGLQDKVVLITGASRGIGETTAKLFAMFGAKVIVNYYRGKDDAERIVKEIEDEGGAAIAVQADVTDSDQVRQMVDKAIEQYRAIHVLVNNAVRDFRPIPFSDITWEDIQRDLDVIVKGAFHCCKAVVPIMVRQGGGKIVNISTSAVDDPPPDQLKYVLAKSALQGLTRSLSLEIAAQNVQVNTVVPSFVETDLVAHIQEGFRKKIAQETPMNRLASPVDVAHAVLFLASSFSSYTTGQKVMVTGGKSPFL